MPTESSKPRMLPRSKMTYPERSARSSTRSVTNAHHPPKKYSSFLSTVIREKYVGQCERQQITLVLEHALQPNQLLPSHEVKAGVVWRARRPRQLSRNGNTRTQHQVRVENAGRYTGTTPSLAYHRKAQLVLPQHSAEDYLF